MRQIEPGGALVLMWNSRDMDDALQRALEELIGPLRREAIAQREGEWREPLDASPLFGPLEEARFAYAQHLTVEGLCERVASTSFVAAMEEPSREALLRDVRGLVVGLDEPFAFRYLTEAYVAFSN